MEYIFIVNPKARSGMGETVWNTLEPELKKKRVSYTLFLTQYCRHAEKIAEAVTADGEEHTLVVLGGDGTVNEVLNGIRYPEKTVMGYIPIGSGNDFVRGLGIPRDPLEAIEVIMSPQKIINIDVGEMERAGKKRRFAVSGGMGFDAAVCHEVCVSKWKILLNRIGLGKLSYAAVALDRLMKDKPSQMTVVTEDGRKRVFEKAYFAAFMNLPYEGGGFKFCPQASPEDGMLDVFVASGISRAKILFLLPTAFAGLHTRFKGIEIFRCREAEIRTDMLMPLHTDGEPGFLRRKVHVRVTGERLRVIVG